MGPKGLFLKETALELCDFFEFTCVSMGDLLRKEVSKKTAVSAEISLAINAKILADDAIVLDLLRQELETLGKLQKSFVVEGFPRTRAQALALQKWGVFPDAVFLVNCSEKHAISAITFDFLIEFVFYREIRRRLREDEQFLARNRARKVEEIAKNCWQEHELNLKEMKEVCRPFFFEIDGEAQREEVLEDIAVN